MFKDAKVADRVWGVIQGWGKVVLVDATKWPLFVKFENGTSETYTFEGKETLRDSQPSLFWDKIDMTPPPRPKRVVKKYVNLYMKEDLFTYMGWAYDSKEQADRSKSHNRVACVEIEVEE